MALPAGMPPSALSYLHPLGQSQQHTPQNLPSPVSLTITAKSQADSSASGSSKVQIQSNIHTCVAPTSATLGTNVASFRCHCYCNTGSIVTATLGGWSCDPSHPPARFDGSSSIGPLPVGCSYHIYVEPSVGTVPPNDITGGLVTLCGSPAAPARTVPAVNTNFSAGARPVP
jgi:hypothetical protein